MKIAVLGTGNVGMTIGAKLVETGHQVMMGSRTADNEKAVSFSKRFPDRASHGTFSDAAAFAELIFNCTAGIGSLEALQQAGPSLGNKIIIDVSNPLDFSQGMPPTLTISNTDSLGEQIQKTFPSSRVVKTLNTMWCGLMVNPGLLKEEHNVFLSGNDASAKESVKKLLYTFGWKESQIIDLGDISTARGTEMYLPLWLRIYSATSNGAFNIRIVS
jgi:8-hydroxy-5-deazaflavin:NADPH oxidoreductase